MRRSTVVILLLLILALQLLLRFPFLAEPMEGDEGAYAYIAQGLLMGEVPYRDTFDHKPPGIYFIYAGIFRLFGESLTALRGFSALYSLATALAVFWFASLLLGVPGGLLSALFFAVFSNGPFLEGTSANSEVFMALPLILSFACFMLAQRKGCLSLLLWSGLLAGTAAMIKQVAVLNFVVLLAFLPVYFAGKDRLKGACLLGGGFLAPVLFFVLYFWSRGALGHLLDNAFLINFSYLRPFERVVSVEWGKLNLYRIGFLLIEESIILLLGSVAVILIAFKDRRRDLLLLASWALSSALSVMVGRYLFGHYFVQLLPPLVVLGAFAVLKWQESGLPKVINAGLIVLIITLATVAVLTFYPFYLVYSPEEISFARYRIDNLALAREVAQIVKARTGPSDRIMVWGTDPQVYFYSQRRYPGRYVFLPFHFPDRFEEACREAESMAENKMVKYVVLSRPVNEQLFAGISRNYRLIMSKAGRYHGSSLNWGVFERK